MVQTYRQQPRTIYRRYVGANNGHPNAEQRCRTYKCVAA